MENKEELAKIGRGYILDGLNLDWGTTWGSIVLRKEWFRDKKVEQGILLNVEKYQNFRRMAIKSGLNVKSHDLQMGNALEELYRKGAWDSSPITSEEFLERYINLHIMEESGVLV